MSMFYIQNRGYVGNCIIWWRKNRCGYTTNLDEALQVGKAEAKRICSSRDKEDVMWPVELVDGIAQRHVDEQSLRLITRKEK